MKESVFDRPLPDAIEAERLILGAALSDSEAFPRIAAILRPDDFSLEKHKRIFLRVSDVYERGDPVSCITVFHELDKQKQSESVDGLSYLLSLTDGIPTLAVLENVCQVVLDKAILRRTIHAAHTLTERCFDAQDRPGDLLADAEAITELITRSSVRRFNARTVAEIISDEGGINAFLSPDSRPGIHVPFPAIHDTLSGLRRSKLILLGARPGTGKTALAVQIAEHAASNGNNVVFISLEMNCRELLHRSITSRARVSSYKFRTGRLTPEERARVREQASELTDLQTRLVQVDEPETTVPYIAALLRSLKAQQQAADLCIIDYLQLLSSVGRFENRVQEVAACREA